MAEYIERDAVMQEFADYVKWCNNSDFATPPTWNEAVQIVEDAPAADVVEVRHGRWVNIVHAAVDTTGDCDQCHCKSVWRTREMPYVICHHCGARMDGGADDGKRD